MKFSSFLTPQVYAQCVPGQDGLNLQDCLTLRDGSKVSQKYSSFSVLINLLVNNLMVIAGLMLFVFVISAGFSFIMGDSKGKEKASTVAKGALTGFVIMFSAYWLVQIIKQLTGADIRL